MEIESGARLLVADIYGSIPGKTVPSGYIAAMDIIILTYMHGSWDSTYIHLFYLRTCTVQ